MSVYFDRLGIFVVVAVLVSLNGCATTTPIIEAHKTQEAMLSRSSYEQIQPAIENIQIGDTRSKVLEIVKPKIEQGQYFKLTKAGEIKPFYFHNWPGVLTPFATRGYLRAPEKLGAMHFGYLDGGMLRPRRILIFAGDKVSKVIDVLDPESFTKEPGVTVKETGPLDHLSKESYVDIFSQKKDQIVPGMHFWEVFTLLGANYFLTPDMQSFVIMCPSYLNYKSAVKETTTTQGVYAVYPFGYMDGDTEVVKWEVEMLNSRVMRVRPYGE